MAEFYQDRERDMGLLARAVGQGLSGQIIEDDAYRASTFLMGVGVRAIFGAISQAPGKWTGETAIALATNLAIYIVREAGWTDDRMKREALAALKVTLAAMVESHIRELGGPA